MTTSDFITTSFSEYYHIKIEDAGIGPSASGHLYFFDPQTNEGTERWIAEIRIRVNPFTIGFDGVLAKHLSTLVPMPTGSVTVHMCLALAEYLVTQLDFYLEDCFLEVPLNSLQNWSVEDRAMALVVRVLALLRSVWENSDGADSF